MLSKRAMDRETDICQKCSQPGYDPRRKHAAQNPLRIGHPKFDVLRTRLTSGIEERRGRRY
jgi:hypothetical protein